MSEHLHENLHSPEIRFQPARIRLEFFRHDDKEKTPPNGLSGDNYIRLTPSGREHATKVGKTKQPTPHTAVAFGSDRERSVETAMRHMLAHQDEITDNMSLEEMRAEIDKHLGHGKKDATINTLNFDWDSNKVFSETAYPYYLNSKNALEFLKNQSDEWVVKNHDTVSDSYSRSAGKIAELIKKYLGILPRWKEINEKNPTKYGAYNNEMQRYFGTHQTVAEPFLMKVISKTQGPEAVEKFLSGLKNKNGFDFSQGYTVLIESTMDEPTIVIEFNGQQFPLKISQLNEIIKEKDTVNNLASTHE